MIPYGRQSINADDVQSVVDVLNSDFLTQGPAVPIFEKALAAYCGAPYAVAMNSATSALHIACLALGVGPGDLVWITAISFVASANCARYCGADVDFVDIDPNTLNISVSALAKKLVHAEKSGRLPKVVIPVDLCGRSAPMQEIRRLADEYGFSVIEDASHAIGSEYQGTKVGGHSFADVTVFSFHPVKIITTAEGGMAVTLNPALGRRLADLRTHGITRDTSRYEHPEEGGWYYEQHELGYNYRLTDLQAALGTNQLSRIEPFIEARQKVRDFYREALGGLVREGRLALAPEDEAADSRSALHLYPVQVLPASGHSRREVYDAMRRSGIGVNVHYLPIYRHPYYRKLGFNRGLCPHAETYYEQAISLPMHPGLDATQLDQVVQALHLALA